MHLKKSGKNTITVLLSQNYLSVLVSRFAYFCISFMVYKSQYPPSIVFQS